MSSGFDSPEQRERAFDAMLHKYRDRIAGGAEAHTPHTPLSDLIAAEESAPDVRAALARLPDEKHVDLRAGELRMLLSAELRAGRQEALRRLLAYFFADGPHPLKIIRRVYAVAKALAPALIGDMSCEDIALLCGDGGRATVSARIKRVYNDPIEKNGGGRVKAPFQKSETAVGKYSDAQKGNHNRKKGTPRRRKRRATGKN